MSLFYNIYSLVKLDIIMWAVVFDFNMSLTFYSVNIYHVNMGTRSFLKLWNIFMQLLHSWNIFENQFGKDWVIKIQYAYWTQFSEMSRNCIFFQHNIYIANFTFKTFYNLCPFFSLNLFSVQLCNLKKKSFTKISLYTIFCKIWYGY